MSSGLFDDLIPARDKRDGTVSYGMDGRRIAPPARSSGLFDDLVPKKSSGLFDDLIPAEGSFLPEVGKGIAGGAVSTTGTMLKGAAGQNAALLQSRIDNAKARLKIMDMIDRGEEPPVGSLAEGDELDTANVYRDLTPEQRKAFRASQERVLATAVQPGDITETPLYQAGQKVQDYSKEQFAAAKDYEDSWTRSIAEGLGSTVPFLASAAAPAVGIGAGSFASSGEALDRAIEAGATREQIIDAIKLGGLPGLTEQIPIETLFERIPLPYVGRFGTALGKILSQAAAEGGQEAVQQVAQNLIARYVYKPDQDIGEGVAEAAAIGSIVGGGLKTVEQGASAVAGRDTPSAQVPARPELAPVLQDEALFGEEPAPAAPPASVEPTPLERAMPELTRAGEPSAPVSEPSRKIELPELERARDIDRPDSPRLTTEDRASPLPNNLIDDGKAILEDVLGASERRPAPELDRAPDIDARPELGSVLSERAPIEVPPAPVTAKRVLTDAEIFTPTAPARFQPASIAEPESLDGDWTRFTPESGTRSIPRSEMPQIKAEHRGALVNFLAGKGVEHTSETVPAESLKPTQAEFSRKKVDKAKNFEGGDRSILVSGDGHILDGHHQWMAARETGGDVNIIRLAAPIEQLLPLAHEFPSSTVAPIKTGKTKREAAPQDIIQFLAAKGGIKDHRGELGSLDLRKAFVPGIGRLVRETGMTLDMAREAAEEAGYIGQAGDYQTTTVADLLNAIDRNRRGERVYSREDAGRAEARQAIALDSRAVAMQDELDAILKESGGHLRPHEMDEVLDLIADGMWPEEALVEVMERNALAAEAEAEQNATPEETFDAPFDIAAEDRARGEPSRTGKSQASEGARRVAPPRAEPRSSEPSGTAAGRAQEKAALSRPTASWVIRDKSTGEVIAETFDRKKVDALNTAKYEAVPIQEHLASLNRKNADDFTDADVPAFLKKDKDQPRFQISPQQARNIPMRTELPTDAVFKEAVANTPGAKIIDDGLLIDLVRYQKNEQAGSTSVRTGVFYLPTGSPNTKHYRGGKNGYGGRVEVRGETLLKKPIFVKGATGGKAPEAAYDQIKGKGAYAAMRNDLFKKVMKYDKRTLDEDAYNFLEEYGADGNLVWDIIPNSKEGNTLAYALQENIVAHAVREAGYDSVVGYSKGRGENGHFISEVFDVREVDYPTPGETGRLHPDFDIRQSRRQTGTTIEAYSGGAQTQYSLSPDFLDKAEAVQKSLRQTLDKMGLPGIGVRVWESMSAFADGKKFAVEGQYFRGLIDIALEFNNPDSTLQHEALHAMRALGLFTDKEWAILTRKSNKEWRGKYQIAENYGMFPEDVQIEEGIAAAYTDWSDGARMDGVIAASFRKIKAFLKGLYQALTGHDITSVDDIFQRIESGEIGRRRVQTRGLAPLHRAQSEIVDTVDGPREQMVIPGTEKISDKELAERKMEGRKGSTKAQKDVGDLPLFGSDKDQMALFQIAWHGSPRADVKAPAKAAKAVAKVHKAAAAALGTRIMDAIKRGKNDGETVGQYSHRKMIDYLHPLRTLIESTGGTVLDSMNAYLQARLADDAVVSRIQDMHGEFVTPMVEALAKSGASLEDLHKYLYARHAPERNRVVGLRNEPDSDLYKAVTDHDIKGASGWSTNEAKKVIAQLRADEKKFAGIQEAARIARQMLDTNLAEQKRAGLISAESYDLLTKQWQHYVPLRSEDGLDENGDFSPSRGRGFDVRGKEFQAAAGRFSEAENIPAWAIALSERTHMRAEHNAVGKAVLRFIAKHDPKGDKLARVYWSGEGQGFGGIEKAPSVHRRVINADGKAVDKEVPPSTLSPTMFAVKDGGRVYYIEFADEKVGAALKNMGVMHLDALSRLARKWTGFQSLINTRANPAFVPINIIRDAATGGIHLLDEGFTKTEAAKIVASIPKAWGALWRNARGKPGSGDVDNALKEYIAAGGKISFEPHKTLEDTVNELRTAMRDAMQGKSKGKAAWQAFVKFVGDLNDAGENGMRLAAYMAAREKGRTVKQAAFIGRDLTVDFKKHGEIGPLMNSWFVFFNASIQGNYNIAVRLAKSKTVRRAAYTIVATGILSDILNRALSGDDDDGESYYEKMLKNEPWKFERQIVIFYGSGEGDYFSVPLPYGYNAMHHLGVQASAAAFGTVDPVSAIGASTRVAFDAFNPIGSGGSWLNMIMPTVLDPAIEVATNKSFTGAPITPTKFPGDVSPDSQSHFLSTPDHFRKTAEFFNWASGGNEVEPGLVDVSPDTYEHLWGYVTGGIGRFFGQSLNVGEKVVTGNTDELEWEDVPIVRSFRGKVDDDMRRSEYYRLREEVGTAKSRYKDYLESGDRADAEDFRSRHPVDIAAIGAFDKAEKQLRKVRKAKRAVDLDDNLSRSQKDEKLKSFVDIELQIMNSARRAYFEISRAN